jgi:hypothetical protein
MMENIDKIQALKNRQLRGVVLRSLALFYPSPITIRSLKGALLERGLTITADTQKVLHYLEDKGYIRTREGNLIEMADDELVELTAQGVDLLEGTSSDPGVDI